MNAKLMLGACLCLVIVFALRAEATGASCQLYGHSCLGGHGKRSDSSSEMAADPANVFGSRATGLQTNAMLQRLLARRLSPDMLAAYAAAAGSDTADMDKRSADYMS